MVKKSLLYLIAGAMSACVGWVFQLFLGEIIYNLFPVLLSRVISLEAFCYTIGAVAAFACMLAWLTEKYFDPDIEELHKCRLEDHLID